MLDAPSDVERALRRLCDFYTPVTASIIMLNMFKNGDPEPFKAGFLSTVDERTELLNRLLLLDHRERALLVKWYLEDAAVTEIAEFLGVSRASCYRLRKQALGKITAVGRENKGNAPAC